MGNENPRIVRFIFFCELAIMTAAFLLAGGILSEDIPAKFNLEPFLEVPLLLAAMAAAWFAAFSSRRLYDSKRIAPSPLLRTSPLGISTDVFIAVLMTSVAVSPLALLIFPEIFEKGSYWQQFIQGEKARLLLLFMLVFFLIASGLTILLRLLIRHGIMQARLRGRDLRSVLIIGTNHRALNFARAIAERPETGYWIKGFVDDEWEGLTAFKKGGSVLISDLKGLGDYLARVPVDEIVVALPVSSAYIYSSKIVTLCLEHDITVRFTSQIFDSRLARGRMDVFNGEPILSLELS